MGRHKPNKLRRERPEQNHDHGAGFEHDHSNFAGHPVNGGLMADLIGSALDGCTTCQDPLLTLLAEDPATIGRLVGLACIAIHQSFGGLPGSLLGKGATEFGALASAGVDVEDEAIMAANMFKVAAEMTPTQRRAAANTALDLLVGVL